MYLNPAIFVLLVAAVFGLSIVILFIIQSYNHLIKKIETADEEKVHFHDRANQKAAATLEDAHKQNIEIIEEANRQAAKILSEANLTRSETQDIVKQKLDELLELQKKTTEALNASFSKNYQSALERLKAEDVNTFQKVSHDIEQTVTDEMKDFTKTLKGETVDAHTIMRERIEEAYATAEQEIQKYKENRIEQVNEATYPLLKNVIGLVIGRNLTISDHEALVTQAIQDARTQIPEFQERVSLPYQPGQEEEHETPLVVKGGS